MAKFVSTVLADTEDVWTDVFKKGGAEYQKPKLVLFRGATSTACGQGQSAMGPFYCPADQKVYIDLGFYETLQKQLGAPGDFTHGTSAQRQRWFSQGLKTGTVKACDTFSSRAL